MMQFGTTASGHATPEKTQRAYARLAGFLFLWLIATGVAGLLLETHITGSGTFAEMSRRVVTSEHLYRVALCIEFIETLSALLLGFALYVTLKPVDSLLAQLAMYWRIGESLLGAVGVMFGFMTLHLYLSPLLFGDPLNSRSEAMIDLLRQAGPNVSATFFSLGSVLFYYLFFKSRYIPRVLSGFGVFASIVVTFMCFGCLVFPEHANTLQYGWAPMAIAEVTTGVWLMLFAVKIPSAPTATVSNTLERP